MFYINVNTIRGFNAYVSKAAEKRIARGLKLPHKSSCQGSGNLAASNPKGGGLDCAKILRILFSRVESQQGFLLVDPSPNPPIPQPSAPCNHQPKKRLAWSWLRRELFDGLSLELPGGFLAILMGKQTENHRTAMSGLGF